MSAINQSADDLADAAAISRSADRRSSHPLPVHLRQPGTDPLVREPAARGVWADQCPGAACSSGAAAASNASRSRLNGG